MSGVRWDVMAADLRTLGCRFVEAFRSDGPALDFFGHFISHDRFHVDDR